MGKILYLFIGDWISRYHIVCDFMLPGSSPFLTVNIQLQGVDKFIIDMNYEEISSSTIEDAKTNELFETWKLKNKKPQKTRDYSLPL